MKNPINRNNLFYSEEDYLFEVGIGLDYIEQDINQTIILYQVDRELTQVNDIYKEVYSNNVNFKEPVELNVIFELNPSQLMTYNGKTANGYYLQTGKLTFGVYEKSLNEIDVDISIGDYIGLQVTNDYIEYFNVVNDGRINYDNRSSMYGYKPFYRTIECAIVDKNEFNGE